MKFLVQGKIMLGKTERSFNKEIEAPSENAARQTVFSLFGSVNGLTRKKVKIEKVEKTK